MKTLTEKQAAARLDEVRAILSTFDIDPNTRNSDSLDFHDLAVWQLREMLEVAYTQGFEAAEKGAK